MSRRLPGSLATTAAKVKYKEFLICAIELQSLRLEDGAAGHYDVMRAEAAGNLHVLCENPCET